MIYLSSATYDSDLRQTKKLVSVKTADLSLRRGLEENNSTAVVYTESNSFSDLYYTLMI